jgi:hypothetical protein
MLQRRAVIEMRDIEFRAGHPDVFVEHALQAFKAFSCSRVERDKRQLHTNAPGLANLRLDKIRSLDASIWRKAHTLIVWMTSDMMHNDT